MDSNKQPKVLSDKVSIFIYLVTLIVGQLFLIPFGRVVVFLYATAGVIAIAYVPMLLVEKISSKLWGISPNPKQRRISFLIYLLAGALIIAYVFIVKR